MPQKLKADCMRSDFLFDAPQLLFNKKGMNVLKRLKLQCHSSLYDMCFVFPFAHIESKIVVAVMGCRGAIIQSTKFQVGQCGCCLRST